MCIFSLCFYLHTRITYSWVPYDDASSQCNEYQMLLNLMCTVMIFREAKPSSQRQQLWEARCIMSCAEGVVTGQRMEERVACKSNCETSNDLWRSWQPTCSMARTQDHQKTCFIFHRLTHLTLFSDIKFLIKYTVIYLPKGKKGLEKTYISKTENRFLLKVSVPECLASWVTKPTQLYEVQTAQ